MPVTSTCGRFDNAPAHIIIVSTKFNPRELGNPYAADTVKKTKEETESAAIEKANKAKAKHDIKAARDAIERLQKMDLARRHELAARRANINDWVPGESKDQRKRRRATERRLAEYAVKIAALPVGYVPIRTMTLRVCFDVARSALSKGKVQGVKIGQVWYASPVEMMAHFEANHERHMASIRKNIERKVARK